MILFLFIGEKFLHIMGLDVRSFRSRGLHCNFYPGAGNGIGN